MPRKHVFLCLWCAGTDITKNEQNKETRAREYEKVQEPKPGKSFQVWIIFMLKEMTRKVLEYIYTIGPWISESTLLVLVYFFYQKLKLPWSTNTKSPLSLTKPKPITYITTRAQLPFSQTHTYGQNKNKNKSPKSSFSPILPRTSLTSSHHEP